MATASALFRVLILFPLLKSSIEFTSEKYFSSTRSSSYRSSFDSPCPTIPAATLDPTSLLSQLNSSLSDVDKAVAAALKEDNSPGGAVLTVVYKNSVIWSKGYGLKNMSDSSSGAPDENTGFRIGSVTKAFTALQTLILRDGGVIQSLDQDITTLYPQFKVNNPYKTKRGITFRQLMSHMSGLPRNVPCSEMFVKGCNMTEEEILGVAAGLRLLFSPGSDVAYSNLGFAILGQITAHILGVAWTDSLTKMVIEPLGMKNTGNSFGPEDLNRIAAGYYPDGRAAALIDVGWAGPAGQSYSSTADLAKLMFLAFSEAKAIGEELSQVIDGESIREWLNPAFMLPDGTGFSFPWELKLAGNYTLRCKDGVMNGYNAQFSMAVESKLGFILLQSCDGCSSHSKIIDIAEALLLSTANILAANQPPPKLPPAPQDYVGAYNSTMSQGIINVTLETVANSPALFLIDGASYKFSLDWEGGEEVFHTSSWGTSLPCSLLHTGHVGSLLYFMRDGGGKGFVVSLTIPGLNFGVVYVKMS